MINRGKQFQQKFKQDFSKIPNSSIDRLYDPTSGYVSISNICDFICYVYPNIIYAECKSHKGNTFSLKNLTQYQKLISKIGIKGVRVGMILWFIDHDKVVYVPIKTIQQMIQQGKKSVNIKDIPNYRIIQIPSIKKKVFLDSDYSILCNLQDGD